MHVKIINKLNEAKDPKSGMATDLKKYITKNKKDVVDVAEEIYDILENDVPPAVLRSLYAGTKNSLYQIGKKKLTELPLADEAPTGARNFIQSVTSAAGDIQDTFSKSNDYLTPRVQKRLYELGSTLYKHCRKLKDILEEYGM